MGLLDEAIREHLELKRRRGADASEIARLEHEALGPVRREPFRADDELALEELHEPRDTSELGAAQGEPEFQDYYHEEYHADDNGADWGDAFADDDLEPRRRPNRRAEAPSEASPEVADEPPLERQAETGSRRWRRRRAADPSADDSTDLPAEHAEPEDPADGKETVEYDVDDALTEGRRNRKRKAADQTSSKHEGDVLEETPEFLQDAPEHDRLWFEQRPPRDFDFDD